MTWFKVDDNYWSHPKVMFQSLEARGLWITGASWAANHLTEGRFPVKVAHLIIPRRPGTINGYADELEATGMWTLDGDAWVFHDWDHYQPSREAVERERKQLRERQAAWRARRSSVSNGPSNGVSNAVTNAAPARPGPARPGRPYVSSGGGPSGPPAATTTHVGGGPEPEPCSHGSAPPLCALCRHTPKGTP